MVYSDVVKNGWILPYKKSYTMKDFNKLHKIHNALTSRFIIICTVTKYAYTEGKECKWSKVFNDILKFEVMDYIA